jgi:hypothetical protein
MKMLRKTPAADLADDGEYTDEVILGFTKQSFKMRGLSVKRIKFPDNKYKSRKKKYENQATKALKKELDKAVGLEPSLQLIQEVAALILLRNNEIMPGKQEKYWQVTRSRAETFIYEHGEDAEKVAEAIKKDVGEEEKSEYERILLRVQNPERKKNNLGTGKKRRIDGITRRSHNKFHQSRRDEWAATHNLFHQTGDTDIVVIVDKHNSSMGFVFSKAFDLIMREGLQEKVTECFDTWTDLYPQPLPEATRHGLHWVKFLRENPQFDFKVSGMHAKSGVSHRGICGAISHPSGGNIVRTRDTLLRGHESQHLESQSNKLDLGAMGACTELIRPFFKALDRSLYKEYVEVAKFSVNHPNTVREEEFGTMRALLCNLATDYHKDSSDWHYGLAWLIPVGDYTGGDLILHDLGLQTKAPPGSLIAIRGRELAHAITEWKGKSRFVVVQTTHDSVRREAYRRMGKELPKDDSDDDQDTCVTGIEGHVPVNQNEDLDDRDIHKEGWAEWSDASSEESVKPKRRGRDVREQIQDEDSSAPPQEEVQEVRCVLGHNENLVEVIEGDFTIVRKIFKSQSCQASSKHLAPETESEVASFSRQERPLPLQFHPRSRLPTRPHRQEAPPSAVEARSPNSSPDPTQANHTPFGYTALHTSTQSPTPLSP